MKTKQEIVNHSLQLINADRLQDAVTNIIENIKQPHPGISYPLLIAVVKNAKSGNSEYVRSWVTSFRGVK